MTRVFGKKVEGAKPKGNRYTHSWEHMHDTAEWEEYRCRKCGLEMEYPHDPNDMLWFYSMVPSDGKWYDESDVPSCSEMSMEKALE